MLNSVGFPYSNTRSGRRQLGSNALASQLYRSSSFNSSGRSSNCDTTEDMYSLENVQDLNYKVCVTKIYYLPHKIIYNHISCHVLVSAKVGNKLSCHQNIFARTDGALLIFPHQKRT
ncbi:uncharacterized protein LOC119683078 [Teleopsis dalmanni]|uniref:uncharacterized protein LOC119683078 n=1 Tax=Teleopsis dalmanni TaxID=139649 RepID=UPI0018CEC238|nr:uncharacterized protein LOC119683078 [Teleopsis dalmanni]